MSQIETSTTVIADSFGWSESDHARPLALALLLISAALLLIGP